jgi:hypothetical protein
MSTPFSSIIRPIVSRISSSTSTRPLSSGFHRSETVLRPPGTASLFQAMPANPDCQVSEFFRPGSKSTFFRVWSKLAAFGMLA